MAKRRTTRKRRAPRRNPSRTRRAARSIRRRSAGSLAGLNIKTALKGIPLNALGMFAAKWLAKKWGPSASETDPSSWNWSSYLKGAGGAAAAGFLANMVKPGSGQKVLEGGMALMLFKLVENEFIAGKPNWEAQLGGVNGMSERVPGSIETNSAGEPFVLGDDGEWYPLEGAEDYNYVLGEEEPYLYGDSALVEPGPLGNALVEPGPLGFGATDPFAKPFMRR
jgi:hypothetical protein